MAQQQLIPPASKEDAYTFEIDFTTTDLSNGNMVIEPHEVTGPTPINVTNPLNHYSISSNVYVPLTTNTSQGANYLVFFLPQPGSSKMHVGFATKSSLYEGGYYFYTQGMTTSYRSDFKEFCRDSQDTSFNAGPKNLDKRVKFSVKGIDTNNVSASVEFQVWFRWYFSNTIDPNPQLGDS
jgi:hypothetical protein